ncbi:hypothetical protein BDN72DRAFT_838495 [Pluteus cervinus]|uniref:Uncharacterized protein n=1 Tax=Pluteus cervinus TaxID=181527 RepID=A0ACD3AZ76_9AGAR|nr:hypothetical protein BDN72DRAFT_838495 [Pluteus cervinus]
MFETNRLLQAALALSELLTAKGTPHAFHGSILPAILAESPHSDEICCIVEGGQTQTHPFRRVRDALSGNEDWATTLSPWTNRLHVSYRRLIPPIDIEILPAGEAGPRHLDASTVMQLQGIPFLTISEFLRARLNSWMIRAGEREAHEISYVLTRFWNKVDVNRILEQDMNQFVSKNQAAAPAWTAVKRKYGM